MLLDRLIPNMFFSILSWIWHCILSITLRIIDRTSSRSVVILIFFSSSFMFLTVLLQLFWLGRGTNPLEFAVKVPDVLSVFRGWHLSFILSNNIFKIFLSFKKGLTYLSFIFSITKSLMLTDSTFLLFFFTKTGRYNDKRSLWETLCAICLDAWCSVLHSSDYPYLLFISVYCKPKWTSALW